MKRRILAVCATAAFAVTAIAPSAQALVYKPKSEPPSCHTSIGNVVYDDPICEPTEGQP